MKQHMRQTAGALPSRNSPKSQRTFFHHGSWNHLWQRRTRPISPELGTERSCRSWQENRLRLATNELYLHVHVGHDNMEGFSGFFRRHWNLRLQPQPFWRLTATATVLEIFAPLMVFRIITAPFSWTTLDMFVGEGQARISWKMFVSVPSSLSLVECSAMTFEFRYLRGGKLVWQNKGMAYLSSLSMNAQKLLQRTLGICSTTWMSTAEEP